MGTHKPILESSGETTRNRLARCWLAVGLAVSAVLFVRAMPNSPLRGSSQQVRSVAVSTTSTSAQGTTASVGVSGKQPETVYVRKLITQPIETIRVGQRVLGTNPNRDELEPFEEPDPETWRTIEVEQIKPSGKRLYATLLRPLEWIEEELDPQTNTIDLDLPELGAEGTAKVLRIGPCPPIAAGAGHIVTATFKHEPDGELLTVTIGDDQIGCTANHPFWSEDRQGFIEAGQLRQGERVRTRLEQVAAVVSIKPRPPTDWVYNLEVLGGHVYEVGPNGALVHSACKDIALGLDPHFKRLAEMTGAVHWRHWFREGITRRGVPDLIDGELLEVIRDLVEHFTTRPSGRITYISPWTESRIRSNLLGKAEAALFVMLRAGRTIRPLNCGSYPETRNY